MSKLVTFVMDDQSVSVFGVFVGIMASVMISLPIFSIFDLPLWFEYVVLIILFSIFTFIGISLTRKFSNRQFPRKTDK